MTNETDTPAAPRPETDETETTRPDEAQGKTGKKPGLADKLARMNQYADTIQNTGCLVGTVIVVGGACWAFTMFFFRIFMKIPILSWPLKLLARGIKKLVDLIPDRTFSNKVGSGLEAKVSETSFRKTAFALGIGILLVVVTLGFGLFATPFGWSLLFSDDDIATRLLMGFFGILIAIAGLVSLLAALLMFVAIPCAALMSIRKREFNEENVLLSTFLFFASIIVPIVLLVYICSENRKTARQMEDIHDSAGRFVEEAEKFDRSLDEVGRFFGFED